MNNWLLLRVPAQSLRRYAEHISEHHPEIELYWPCYVKLGRPHGCRHAVRRTMPVWPGYVFARGGSTVLLTTPVRAWFVRFGQDVAIVNNVEIMRIKANEEANMYTDAPTIEPKGPCWRIGDHVQCEALGLGRKINGVIKRIARDKAELDTAIGRVWVPTATITLGP